MKLRNIVFILALFPVFGFSQFNYRSDIPEITADGYYRILVRPDILALSSPGMSDLRIKNSENKEIPYFIKTENPRKEEISLEYFNIIQNEFTKKDSLTSIIIDNTTQEELDQFCIVSQAADIQKFISIKGSDDKENWYIVKQKTLSGIGYPQENTTEILVTNFPRGKYRYYQILISNPQNDPIKVLHVGKYKSNEIFGKYTEIGINNFIQTDSSNKKTYIRFPNAEINYFADKIGFEIEFNTDYLRNASIIPSGESNSYYNLQNFTLSSKSQNIIPIDGGLKLSKNTVIEIENKDNLPLKIKNVNLFQLNRYLTVFLEKGDAYTIYFGDKSLSSPQYDIVYFEKDIPDHLQELEPGPILKSDVPNKVEDHGKILAFYEKPLFMWIIIIAVGASLLIMCLRLIKTLNNKEKD